ncbi:hypothetical protein C5167_024394 [Papaver somniferum]|uniref:Uncharacterized protein n=1 Tax=Papaver somniferum TaxID=3469 RepID=A0A4Y7JS33_PAPSO|nr:hypothetical protein C5167_024394 [Papaver somniferum]
MEDEEEGEESDRGIEMRYVPFFRINSSTDHYVAATVGSPNVMSQKKLVKCATWRDIISWKA